MDENKEKKDISIDLKTNNYDPLIKVKKIATAIIVITMVVAMIIVFASFHWLYIEHTKYITNKSSLETTFIKRQEELKNDIKRYEHEREKAFQEIALLKTNDIPHLKSKKAELEASIIDLVYISNEVLLAIKTRDQLTNIIVNLQNNIDFLQGKELSLNLQIRNETLKKDELTQITNVLSKEITSLTSDTNKFTEKLNKIKSDLKTAENNRDAAIEAKESAQATKKDLDTTISNLTKNILTLQTPKIQLNQESGNVDTNSDESEGDN